MSNERDQTLRAADSTLLWIYPVTILGHIFLLSDLNDIFNRLVAAGAHPVFSALDAVTNVTSGVAVWAALAAGLLLAVSLARQKSAGRYIRFVPAALFGLAVFFFPFSLACTLGSQWFPHQEFCRSLPFGDNQFFPTLFVSMLVMALALPRSAVGARSMRWAFGLLALVVLNLALQVAELFAWATIIWGVPQSRLAALAHLADRQVWFAGDWHWLLALGLVVVSVCVLAGVRAVWQGVTALTAAPA